MKRIEIAFDIDGTLRCNHTRDCQDPNQRIVSLARIFGSFKNARLHAWSGGGKEYTWQFIRTHGLAKLIPQNRCHSKLAAPKMDIAIDDQHGFELAGVNLIVQEKGLPPPARLHYPR